MSHRRGSAVAVVMRPDHRRRRLVPDERPRNRAIAPVRAKVGRTVAILKLRYGCTRVRYGNLARSSLQLSPRRTDATAGG